MGFFKKSKDGPPADTSSQSPMETSGPAVQQPRTQDTAPLSEAETKQMILDANRALENAEKDDPPPPMPQRPEISLNTKMENLDISSEPTPASAMSSTSDGYFSLSEISPLPSASADTEVEAPATASAISKLKSGIGKGYNATTHFAGGLLSHPHESTKHFSILRHSNGLVFYQGTSTSLPISIFSDAPLPAEHTLYLQSKGWSGDSGMALKALVGRNGYWLNVTPSIRAEASQLDPVVEKAYQRDIKFFLKKSAKNVRKTHVLRQTCLVRIPVQAGDGYFRLVLCVGEKKKVLCPSPVFRVLSTSISPSSMKGSSLSTLPLEMGAMVLTTAAKVATFKAAAPVKLVAMAPIAPYMPGGLAKHAGKAVYSVSGAGKRVDATVEDANERYNQLHGTLFSELGGAEATPDSGPVDPYPIDLSAVAEPVRKSSEEGIASLNLQIQDEDTAHRLHGHYIAWARVTPVKLKKSKKNEEGAPTSWYQAVISAVPTKTSELSRLHVSHTNHKTITMTLVEDTNGTFVNASIDVKVMGFIRPASSTAPAAEVHEDENPENETVEQQSEAMKAVADMAIAQASLDRPAWGPEVVLERVPTGNSEKGVKGGMEIVKTRYAHTRTTVSRQIDRVPFYRAGLRVGADRLREQGVGTGGIYVVRD